MARKSLHKIFFFLFLFFFPALSFAEELLSGAVICGGSVSTAKEFVADGRFDTYFATNETQWTWVGFDFGERCVVSRLIFVPRDSDNGPQRMVLGVFEGANLSDFSDAVPLHIIQSEPERGRYTSVAVGVSRGFRYVRYVTPAGGKCNIAELAFFGTPGEGDDSRFHQLTALPTVSIHVAGNENPTYKGHDHQASLTIVYDGGARIQEYPILTRVRGNFSASWENKPYRIKFDDGEKHHMLKGSADESPAKAKKWTLISSFGDKTLMRNPVAYEISRRVGLPFTPWCKPVDLILNGEYRGTYQLTDHVDVKADRVNITEMTAADLDFPAITGGYLLEMNGYAGADPVNFTSWFGNPVTIHSPEDDVIQEAQKAYITNHFNEMERRVFADNYTDPEEGYRTYLDLTSFLKYFLANEFSSNTDYLWQVYMFKQRGDDHIYTGPVWDNDLALENDINYYPGNQCQDWVYKVRGAGNWRSLVSRVLSDPYAMQQLREMWAALREREIFTPENIAVYVDSLREQMEVSASLNFKRWPYLHQQLHCNPKVYGSWQEEVDNVRDYVYGRVGWMDDMLAPPPPPEDLSDANPLLLAYRYYMLRISRIKDQSVLQLSEFDLLDAESGELPSLQAYAANIEGYGGENWQNLTDNNVQTKYCSPFYGDTYIMFDAGETFAPFGYRLYTANDTQNYSGRNPDAWQLFASNVYTLDPDDPAWEMIDSVDGDKKLQAANFTPFTFKLYMLQAAAVERTGQEAGIEAVFSPSGMLLPALQRGLNIVRMSDGTVKKVFCR